MPEPNTTPTSRETTISRERNLAARATMLLAQHVCQSISDMSGALLIPCNQSLRWSTVTPASYMVALVQFAGKTSGAFSISVPSDAMPALLQGCLPDAGDMAADASQVVFSDFIKEVLNAAVNQALPALTEAIGVVTTLPPILARGTIGFHDVEGAFLTCEGSAGALDCGCLMDMARLGIGVDLEAAQEKLRLMHDRNASLWIKPEDLPDARFSVVYKPLNEAGGDVYDVFRLPEGRIGYFIGDVAGHDISTGLASASIRAMLRVCILQDIAQTEALRLLNDVLLNLFGRMQYATACYAIVDRIKGEAIVANMGHPALLVFSKNGPPRSVKANNPPIGMIEHLNFCAVTVPLNAGDRLVLFTDGLLESSGKITWVRGLPKLVAASERICEVPIEDAARIVCDIAEISRRPYDDIVALCIDV
jgi:hypothetical protein